MEHLPPPPHTHGTLYPLPYETLDILGSFNQGSNRAHHSKQGSLYSSGRHCSPWNLGTTTGRLRTGWRLLGDTPRLAVARTSTWSSWSLPCLSGGKRISGLQVNRNQQSFQKDFKKLPKMSQKVFKNVFKTKKNQNNSKKRPNSFQNVQKVSNMFQQGSKKFH